MKIPKTLFLASWCLFWSSSAFTQQSNFHDSRDKVAISVKVTPSAVTPGGDAILAVILQHEEHWHSHTNDPQVPEALGDLKITTQLNFILNYQRVPRSKSMRDIFNGPKP